MQGPSSGHEKTSEHSVVTRTRQTGRKQRELRIGNLKDSSCRLTFKLPDSSALTGPRFSFCNFHHRFERFGLRSPLTLFLSINEIQSSLAHVFHNDIGSRLGMSRARFRQEVARAAPFHLHRRMNTMQEEATATLRTESCAINNAFACW